MVELVKKWDLGGVGEEGAVVGNEGEKERRKRKQKKLRRRRQLRERNSLPLAAFFFSPSLSRINYLFR